MSIKTNILLKIPQENEDDYDHVSNGGTVHTIIIHQSLCSAACLTGTDGVNNANSSTNHTMTIPVLRSRLNICQFGPIYALFMRYYLSLLASTSTSTDCDGDY